MQLSSDSIKYALDREYLGILRRAMTELLAGKIDRATMRIAYEWLTVLSRPSSSRHPELRSRNAYAAEVLQGLVTRSLVGHVKDPPKSDGLTQLSYSDYFQAVTRVKALIDGPVDKEIAVTVDSPTSNDSSPTFLSTKRKLLSQVQRLTESASFTHQIGKLLHACGTQCPGSTTGSCRTRLQPIEPRRSSLPPSGLSADYLEVRSGRMSSYNRPKGQTAEVSIQVGRRWDPLPHHSSQYKRAVGGMKASQRCSFQVKSQVVSSASRKTAVCYPSQAKDLEFGFDSVTSGIQRLINGLKGSNAPTVHNSS